MPPAVPLDPLPPFDFDPRTRVGPVVNERQRDAFVDYVNSLKAKATISIDEKVLASLGIETAELSAQGELKNPASATAPVKEEAKATKEAVGK